MGLLQKLNSGVYDTPELSFKENQNIKSQENILPIYINDFLISNEISSFAVLEIINNHYFITNSFGYDVKSIYSSYSTVDFWNGLIKETNKIYNFNYENNSITHLFQFFSGNLIESIKQILVYKTETNKIYIFCLKKTSNKLLQIQNQIKNLDLSFNLSVSKIETANSNFTLEIQNTILEIVSENIRNKFYLKNSFFNAIKAELVNRLNFYFSNNSKISLNNDNKIEITANINSKDFDLLEFHINENLKDILGANWLKLSVIGGN